MIVDVLENFHLYENLNPLFSVMTEYMTMNKLAALADGKTEIKGKDLFVNSTVAKGKTPDEARLETHDQMIDVQIPLSGSETFGFTSRKNLSDSVYDVKKDITFYDEPADTYLTVRPGQFVIFFPQDGHAPCISDDDFIRKVIFKVKN